MRNQKAANKAKSWQATKLTCGKRRTFTVLSMYKFAFFLLHFYIQMHLKLTFSSVPQLNVGLKEDKR
jgi:hypothetical protein